MHVTGKKLFCARAAVLRMVCMLVLISAFTDGASRLYARQQEGRSAITYHIAEIRIRGNRKTKKEVILREMKTRPGDTVTLEELEYDLRRIESLGLFSRVQMSAEKAEGPGITLVIEVTEQLYIIPWPIFYFNDRDYSLKKLSFGAALIHMNFRGKGENVQVAGWLGYNPGVYWSYRNPWFGGNRRIFLESRFFLYHFRNKSYDIVSRKVTEKRVGASLRLGKRFTLKNSASIEFDYSQLRLDPAVPGQTLHPDGTDKIPTLRLRFVRNSRDLIWFPSTGLFLRAEYSQSGVYGDAFIDYSRLRFDFRKYFSLPHKMVFALRLNVDLSKGILPIYDRLFFGYDYRVRGYFPVRVEGENRGLFSTELRFPLLPVRYFSIENSRLGPYGKNLEFGLSAAFFFDAGTLWIQKQNRDFYEMTTESGEKLHPLHSGIFGLQTRPETWFRGFGFSLLFHLPYVRILRMELAFDAELNRELIFDTGVAF